MGIIHLVAGRACDGIPNHLVASRACDGILTGLPLRNGGYDGGFRVKRHMSLVWSPLSLLFSLLGRGDYCQPIILHLLAYLIGMTKLKAYSTLNVEMGWDADVLIRLAIGTGCESRTV